MPKPDGIGTASQCAKQLAAHIMYIDQMHQHLNNLLLNAGLERFGKERCNQDTFVYICQSLDPFPD
jgi:hypothetical protein